MVGIYLLSAVCSYTDQELPQILFACFLIFPNPSKSGAFLSSSKLLEIPLHSTFPPLDPLQAWRTSDTLGWGYGSVPVPHGDFVFFQTLEKIEDMAVSLIREEWLLDPSQKDPSRDNRPENYRNMFSLGKESSGYYYQLRCFVSLLCDGSCELSERQC